MSHFSDTYLGRQRREVKMRFRGQPTRYVGHKKTSLKFGGKRYDAMDYAELKKDALVIAKYYRDNGYYARIARRSGWQSGKPTWFYIIFVRSRK